VFALRDGQVEKFELDAKDYGIARSTIDDVRGGDAAENLRIMNAMLGGAKGPVRDIVMFNAASALFVAGLVSDLNDGLDRAAASIDSGAAAEVLASVAHVSRENAERMERQ
jgi:anthranilate phosphoribosyltransferase